MTDRQSNGYHNLMNVARPRFKSREERIREIRGAAKKLFFANGYQNSTVDEIARLLKIGKGTVYFYFKNKDDLYISLMTPVTEEMAKRFKVFESEINNGKYEDGYEVIKGFFDLFYSLYKYDPEGIKIVQSFQQGNLFSRMSEKTFEALNSLARGIYQVMRDIISKSKKIGLLKKSVDEFVLADILWATFIGGVQLEESKLRVTKKDHLYETLNYAFAIIAKATCNHYKNSKMRKYFGLTI